MEDEQRRVFFEVAITGLIDLGNYRRNVNVGHLSVFVPKSAVFDFYKFVEIKIHLG
jgi:hypothetical protein